MDVVVPFSPTDPKSRLSPVLTARERREFARVLLEDVLSALAATAGIPEPTVLSTAALEVDPGVPVRVDDRALTPAVNDALASSSDPVAVVMADLALATPAALSRLFAPDADVVLAPGRRVGTNAIVARHPAFRVDYHGASFLDHRAAAASVGADVAVVDSHRLATDVDEPADLVEVLAHGEGAAADWLRDHGFEVGERADGTVHARRHES
ncbi:2-phospho-L-lactate guanylyltransferase [Halorubellus sp. JP-L1]|uniref:2-phospho-L-lactate guanylyltransferase n=1 Tax=Halorubellus sp. JP-L1 TaxID=2715753 RepID=UPI001408AECC|nr:2-phospho-L-lactate guanylyltransferase [Halorubellus sp. JP-L1]